MIDCPLEQLADTRWWCPRCDPDRKRLLSQKARRNCRSVEYAVGSTQYADSGGRVPPTAYRLLSYAQALARWIAAGRPVRTDWEVMTIHSQHCYPCDDYDSQREICTVCGCKAKRQGMAVRNKIKMATESCPKRKW